MLILMVVVIFLRRTTHKYSFPKALQMFFFLKVFNFIFRERKPNVYCKNIGEFACSRCPFRSTRKSEVWRHESYHNERLELQCLYCSFSTSHPSSMSKHAKRVHQQVKLIKANFCSFSSSYSAMNKVPFKIQGIV